MNSEQTEVVAVIPARSGSKGIPNKNIRFLLGKPMIAYAIETAKASQIITRVIVSTDSPEVKIIAHQLGVEVHERSADLCGDAVTLDAVIFDAVKNIDCQVVVTMQPTSPTLTSQTLDAALTYFRQKELDTLISAINRPHLAWTRTDDGKIVPAYKKRLNRQYLPPYYSETGAFVIARRNVVTESTRIGDRVEVYEIPESESYDIDTYDDLIIAERHLQKSTIAFYVNGNNGRGVGHVYRVLELADAFFSKVDIYYDKNQTDRSIFGQTTHNLIGLDGIGELLAALEEKKYSLFINDILDTNIDYMIAVKKALPSSSRVINFEDGGEGANKADLVFNALFQHGDLPHVMAGEKYFISAKLFMYYNPIPINDKVKTVFVSFGGADPSNYTDTLLDIISKPKYENYNFEVVLGRAKTNYEALLKYNSKPNITVYRDVANMPEIMSRCDIGITSRGRTGYELAMLGIPSIAMAQNEREERHGFVCAENGFSYLGLHPSVWTIESTLDMYLGMSRSDRQHYHDMLLSHDLRNGRKRVLSLINNLT